MSETENTLMIDDVEYNLENLIENPDVMKKLAVGLLQAGWVNCSIDLEDGLLANISKRTTCFANVQFTQEHKAFCVRCFNRAENNWEFNVCCENIQQVKECRQCVC